MSVKDELELTADQQEVIQGWQRDGASIACRHLSKVEDAILAEHPDEISAEQKLELIRELRLIRREISTFIPADMMFTKGGTE